MSSEQYKGNKILLVEDEESLAIGLEYNLSEEEFDVTLAKDGRQAITEFNSKQFPNPKLMFQNLEKYSLL